MSAPAWVDRCEGGGCRQKAAAIPFVEFRGQGMSWGVRRLCLWCWHAIRVVKQAAQAAGGAA